MFGLHSTKILPPGGQDADPSVRHEDIFRGRQQLFPERIFRERTNRGQAEHTTVSTLES